MSLISSPAKSKRVEDDEEPGPSSPNKKAKQEPCSSQHQEGRDSGPEIPIIPEEAAWDEDPDDRPFMVLSGNRTMDIRKGVHFRTQRRTSRGVYIHFEHYEEEIDPFSWEPQVKREFEFDVSVDHWRMVMKLKEEANAAIARLQEKGDLDVDSELFVVLGGLRVFEVRKYEGNILVDVRDQYVDRNGQLRFSKSGIALTVAQWKLLQQSEEEINGQIAAIEKAN